MLFCWNQEVEKLKIYYLEFRHKTATVGYSTRQNALKLEGTCKSSASYSATYSGLCPSFAQSGTRCTPILLLN